MEMWMTFAELIAAAEKGAATIYHAVLATGAEIASWESNPLVTPLVAVGVSAANGMLARAGVDTAITSVIESDVTTALKSLAATDPTVPSTGPIAGLAGLAGSVAIGVNPGLGPVIGLAESMIGTVESLVTKATPAASPSA
jgi:hypothetical protein